MNKAMSLAALAITFLSFGPPQGKPTDELEIDRQEISNLENETARAMQLHNGTFFRRVYSDDFAGTTANGQLMDKAKYIDAIQSSTAQYNSFTASEIRVRLYEETAVVNALWTSRGTFRGQPFANQLRVTHVYINGPRGWQAVASQETLLPSEARPAH